MNGLQLGTSAVDDQVVADVFGAIKLVKAPAGC